MAVRLCAVLFVFIQQSIIIILITMKHSLRSISLTLAFFAFGSAFAQGPNGSGTYYQAADGKKGKGLSGKVLGMFFLFHSILYLCIMNMLEQLARIVLPKEILDNFDIVKIETDESDIDSMSMTIYLDERMNAYLQKSEDYESKGFMDAVRITDFPIRDHKVILVLRRRRWKNKETGETFVDRISVTESGTRYSKEFAAFLKETYGHIPDDLPYA